MCGIIGIVSSDINRERLTCANNVLTHRGPDDAGLYVGDGVGLAARRLSIIDLDGGHQPLSNETGDVWVTFNGEIYNAPQLRNQLVKNGHRFATHTDTEVLVHAYEEWGVNAIERLRGMFAFGLWDAPRKRLILVRDRFGIKPLYYAHTEVGFAFASEIRPLFALLPNLSNAASRAALAQIFTYGFVSTPNTAFEHVFQLLPAHYMVVSGGNIEMHRYWELTLPTSDTHTKISIADAADAFAEKLTETVKTWKLSDVPVGSLLSGGIDSGMLAALLAQTSPDPITTFHIAFDAATHDESSYARATAEHIRSAHRELRFSAHAFDLLPDVVRHLETPLGSATAIPIAMLYRACHEAGFKVILTGEGADELLGGYHWYDGDRRVRPLLQLPSWLRRGASAFPLPISSGGRRVLRNGNRDAAQRFSLWHTISTPEMREALFMPAMSINAPSPFSPHAAKVAQLHPFDTFTWMDAHTRLPDLINLEIDRMSMMFSVEARPPFLDHTLWEFCAKLPPTIKLIPGENKRVLRKMAQAYLPQDIRQRPKKGLATPHALWFRQPALPAWAEEALHPAALEDAGYFSPATVAQVRNAHQTGQHDHSRLLMGVLTTQLWDVQVRKLLKS